MSAFFRCCFESLRLPTGMLVKFPIISLSPKNILTTRDWLPLDTKCLLSGFGFKQRNIFSEKRREHKSKSHLRIRRPAGISPSVRPFRRALCHSPFAFLLVLAVHLFLSFLNYSTAFRHNVQGLHSIPIPNSCLSDFGYGGQVDCQVYVSFEAPSEDMLRGEIFFTSINAGF